MTSTRHIWSRECRKCIKRLLLLYTLKIESYLEYKEQGHLKASQQTRCAQGDMDFQFQLAQSSQDIDLH